MFKSQHLLCKIVTKSLVIHHKMVPAQRLMAAALAPPQQHPIMTLHLSPLQMKKKNKKQAKQQQFVRADDVDEYIDLLSVKNEMSKVVDDMKHKFATKVRMSNDVTLFETLRFNEDDVTLSDVAEISLVNPRLVRIDMSSFPEWTEAVMTSLRSHEFGFNPALSPSSGEIDVTLPQATHRQVEARVKMAETIVKDHTRMLKKIRDQTIKQLKQEQGSHLPKDLLHLITQQLDAYVMTNTQLMDKSFQAKKKSLQI